MSSTIQSAFPSTAADAVLSPRRRHLLAALGAAALGSACGQRPDASAGRQFGGQSMGSTWSVRLAGARLDDRLAEAARAAVAAALQGVVARMSTYDATSEVGRFNRHAATTPLAMSADTLAVLARAQQVSRLSGGAFDATVAPLVAAWGFGAGASARGAAPAAAELAAPVGWQQLTLDATQGRVAKAAPALQLDLSGIAKGHAVDLAALALEGLGIAHYMVEAGGEIRTRGHNAQGRPWQIAVERPDAWPQQAYRVVPLSGLAMATSGDYRSFYLQGDQRIHHEIDPATRAPARHGLASVTVVHPECMAADAWATALFVRGPAQGLALAQAQQLAALFIVRQPGGGLRDLATPAFAALG
jgi:FAD:protein FMN transferase